MRERPQRLNQLCRLAAASQFEANGRQNRARMFDQRIRLSKITVPFSVASGYQQSPSLERSQIDAGLILGYPRHRGDHSDG